MTYWTRKHIRNFSFLLGCIFLPCVFSQAESIYNVPFVEEATYDQTIPDPNEVLGYRVGTKPATYQETYSYFQALSQASSNVQFYTYGKTHEGRTLFYIVVSSTANMNRLDDLKSQIKKLSDPRGQDQQEIESILQQSPAIAWMAYSIHGDELSSTDAAIWLAYQLAAGQDEQSRQIRDHTVVCIDPLQNPDGRERFLAQMKMFNGKILNPDVQSANHAGVWPWGRGNHYLFDLNRDFFILSQPETRGRVKALREWNPQLFVDSHEMGPLDTYLFSPPREPINPNLTPMHEKWAHIFAQDQAQAFDRYGWSYYTREWLDMWYPGYTEWIAYAGAIMILYEQAGVDGSAVRRPDGTTLTYRESVHHHITSSLANLATLAHRREELLRDYYLNKKESIQPLKKNEIQAYLIEPATNTTREIQMIEKLLSLGVEIYQAQESFKVQHLTTVYNQTLKRKSFPKGTWIIPTQQPMKHLVHALLEFDPKLKDAFLKEERFYLEKKNETRLYDVSAWSMPVAYHVSCYTTTSKIRVPKEAVASIPSRPHPMLKSNPKYGYAIDCRDDRSTFVITRLLSEGVNIRVSDEPFDIGNQHLSKGSYVIRNVENQPEVHDLIRQISKNEPIQIYPADTALDLNKIDLGGGHFRLLVPPRIGILMGRTVSTTSYGTTWYFLDDVYKVRASSLDIDNLARLDLRKYNLLIVPSVYSRSAIQGSALNALKQWIENGGTLLALGSSVAIFTQSKNGLSAVRERADVLDQLDVYAEAVEREENALTATASQDDIYAYSPDTIPQATPEKKSKPNLDVLKRQDAWERRFSPQGTFLRCRIDPFHWLVHGIEDPLAVMVGSRNSYYSKLPVETPVRFTDEDTIRISGLLWPEARKRFATSAYVTREGKGKGQIILFPFEPHIRGYYPQTSRILWNAVFLGPGLGAQAPLPW